MNDPPDFSCDSRDFFPLGPGDGYARSGKGPSEWKGLKVAISPGLCPFMFCVRGSRHPHPICGTCGAMNWGNMGCAECLKYGPPYRGKQLRQAISEVQMAKEIDKHFEEETPK